MRNFIKRRRSKASLSSRGDMMAGLAFLAPNMVGVMVFVIFPVVLSLVMAFSNWDLKIHNQYRHGPVNFVGLDNFIDLATQGDFLRYLGNTLFFMMGIPVSVAGSLIVAMLLSRDTRGGSGRRYIYFITGVLLVTGCGLLACVGMSATAMTMLLLCVAGGILILGTLGGNTVYRTLFYVPHFVAGVATFILWKKLYDPQVGPIDMALEPVLDGIAACVRSVPEVVVQSGFWIGLLLLVAVLAWGVGRLRRMVVDGDLGVAAAALAAPLLIVPTVVASSWSATAWAGWLPIAGTFLIGVWQVHAYRKATDRFTCAAMDGVGGALMLAAGVMVAQFILLGLAAVAQALPMWVAGMAAHDAPGLSPPHWLTQYSWAKPALMIMGFWAAIGSNNMLLYLAALGNVPTQLYEAAEIDGAGPLPKFWHVTWPQLAPTTFFIVVMATIGGLQGGFEMARVMTNGGPAGATTTLSYFIYTEGFQTGRLGFASAVAWALFALVFVVTLFNWTFGNRYVND